jgi:Flp pilus assembly protein TadB
MMEQRAGWWMMGYALCSIIFGHIVIQRIVRIKV